MKAHKLTIIGTITRDTITFPDGKKSESLGGIIYNILPLAYLAPAGLSIAPVCNLGADIYDRVLSHLKKFKNIDTSGISRVNANNNHVHLRYDKKWNQSESLENLVPKITLAQIRPFLKSDYILINFISGFDLDLDVLKKIRAKTKARIFMDVHSLVLGIRKNGERFYKAPCQWKEYLAAADIVQMNLKEMQTLAGKRFNPVRDLAKFARGILSLGPEIFILTRGSEGSAVYHRRGNRMISCRTSLFKVKDFLSPTGCGDFFTSGFILAYLKTREVTLSAEFANFLAGMKSRFSAMDNFLNIFLEKKFF
jgi:sugar/nucleoside kinase (ribokinase family)